MERVSDIEPLTSTEPVLIEILGWSKLNCPSLGEFVAILNRMPGSAPVISIVLDVVKIVEVAVATLGEVSIKSTSSFVICVKEALVLTVKE